MTELHAERIRTERDDQPEVPGLQTELNESAARLAKDLEQLYGRLEPVLEGPRPEDSERAHLVRREPVTPLGRYLHERIFELDRLSDVVGDVVRRLHL